MTRLPNIRPAWTIVRAIWLEQGTKLAGLITAGLVFGLISRGAVTGGVSGDVLTSIGLGGLGLSLFLTFAICGFTEADRKDRFSGFPRRLFTLPVSTRTLVAAPMAFSVVMATVVYAVWARCGVANRDLPLAWPILYLGAGMICYQAILWTLARFRITRLIVLGYCGALFAIGWTAFRAESGTELSLDLGESARRALCWGLVGLSAFALMVARTAIEIQRRGGIVGWGFWRRAKAEESRFASPWRRAPGSQRILERAFDALPWRSAPFRSPSQAQFWFEWRRHGMLLPLATAGVLFVIMAPAPFIAPVSSGMTVLALGWILATPLLIAFVLGKGLGKADLWARNAVTPAFLATRPISHDARIGAKMRMAAWAAVAAWALVILTTSLWLWLWCDCEWIIRGWIELGRAYSTAGRVGVSALSGVTLILLTFRFLAGSLYIGLSGRQWMLNVAACGVFVAIFGGLFAILALSQNAGLIDALLRLPKWLPWVLGAVFVARVVVALWFGWHARRRGWIVTASAIRYGLFWLTSTATLVSFVWWVMPLELSWKWLLTTVAISVVPLLRIAWTPIALGARPMA